jgi:2-(1,2-epoxy-1,2-dihydrophenyl)acetyl-CoA isomerase
LSTSPLVHLKIDSGVMQVSWDHPPANAFNDEIVFAIQAALTQAAQDTQVRCILLVGRGHYFCTGQDLISVAKIPPDAIREHVRNTFHALILQIRRLEKPVIAGINGITAGAGLGVALACDLRIASAEAKFVAGFTNIGLGLDSGLSLLLPLFIGLGRSAEVAFTNIHINAQQALAWGLVNRLSPPDQFLDQALTWAAEIAHGPLNAFGLVKRQFNLSVLSDLEQILEEEAGIQEIAGQSEEFRQGYQAFLAKKPAKFT